MNIRKPFLIIMVILSMMIWRHATGEILQTGESANQPSEASKQPLITVSSQFSFNPMGKMVIISVTNNSEHPFEGAKLVAISFDKEGRLLPDGMYEVSLTDSFNTQSVKPKSTGQFSSFVKEEAHQVKYIVKQALFSNMTIWNNPNYQEEVVTALGDQYSVYLKKLGQGIVEELRKPEADDQLGDLKETRKKLKRLQTYQKIPSDA